MEEITRLPSRRIYRDNKRPNIHFEQLLKNFAAIYFLLMSISAYADALWSFIPEYCYHICSFIRLPESVHYTMPVYSLFCVQENTLADDFKMADIQLSKTISLIMK